MKKHYILAILTIWVFGCDNVLDYNPPYTPKLVVNAFFAHDSLFTVAVSKNIPATNIEAGIPGVDPAKKPHPTITNAIVEVYENGKFIEMLPYIAPSSKAGVQAIGVYRSKTNRAISGKSYTLKVRATGLNDVEASTTIPPINPLLDKTVKPHLVGNEKKYIDSSFTLKDDGKENYYMLTYEIESNESGKYVYQYGGTSALATNDLALKSGLNFFDKFEFSNEPIRYSFLTFPNTLFKSEKQAFYFQIAPGSGHSFVDPSERYKIKVLSISKDFYLNYYDHYTQMIGDSDPFSLPQRVHSNIKGGLGIFASYTLQTYYVQ